MKELLEDIWEHVSDPYWRADHPEITAALLSVISGVIGLGFAWLQHKIITRRPSQ